MSANPLLLWMKLGVRTNEMLVASAQVIGHRTARMASATPIPSEPDQREFALMGCRLHNLPCLQPALPKLA